MPARRAATWIIPSGSYEYNEAGEPLPGTYYPVDHDPQQILLDSLKAPINGLYGVQDETGNISFWNYGELFGAIDVALFIIVIGGFLGVTMQTGAINAGIASVVKKMQGREKWMIPVLMAIFALGGTSYGMAEETLAFYPLIIAVMIAAGYDAMTGAAVIMLGAGIGVLGSTVNPFATGIASTARSTAGSFSTRRWCCIRPGACAVRPVACWSGSSAAMRCGSTSEAARSTAPSRRAASSARRRARSIAGCADSSRRKGCSTIARGSFATSCFLRMVSSCRRWRCGRARGKQHGCNPRQDSLSHRIALEKTAGEPTRREVTR